VAVLRPRPQPGIFACSSHTGDELADVLLAGVDDLRDPVVGLVEEFAQQERGALRGDRVSRSTRKASESESAIPSR
jgi:hypothetical protein